MNWDTFGNCALTMLWAMSAAVWLNEAARREVRREKLFPFLVGIIFMLVATHFLYLAVGGTP